MLFKTAQEHVCDLCLRCHVEVGGWLVGCKSGILCVTNNNSAVEQTQ